MIAVALMVIGLILLAGIEHSTFPWQFAGVCVFALGAILAIIQHEDDDDSLL